MLHWRSAMATTSASRFPNMAVSLATERWRGLRFSWPARFVRLNPSARSRLRSGARLSIGCDRSRSTRIHGREHRPPYYRSRFREGVGGERGGRRGRRAEGRGRRAGGSGPKGRGQRAGGAGPKGEGARPKGEGAGSTGGSGPKGRGRGALVRAGVSGGPRRGGDASRRRRGSGPGLRLCRLRLRCR